MPRDDKMRTAGVITRMLLTDRGDYNIVPPNWEPLKNEVIFDEHGLPIPEMLKSHFKREGLLSEHDALHIITRCAMIWRNEPNIVLLRNPVVVCGDIHGQFYDLLTLLDIGGDPSEQRYIFLGDYIDRGCFGMEVILLLMSYKICYPDTFIMLRGNHESRHLTSYFNFKREVLYKYSLAVYNAMMSAFDCLPLCCLWENRFLCVHGGISPEIAHLDDINAIHRFREPPSSGPMGDLLWSDPMDEKETDPVSTQMFVPNTTRGCSYVYSHAAACKFIAENKLTTIIRGHEAQGEGFHLYKKTPRGFPAVICIFSAPNYCDTYNNRAAVIMLDKSVMNIRQYNSKEHPYYLPNYINAFEWSLTFVAEKLSNFCSTLLKYDTSLLHQLIDKATVHIDNDSVANSINSSSNSKTDSSINNTNAVEKFNADNNNDDDHNKREQINNTGHEVEIGKYNKNKVTEGAKESEENTFNNNGNSSNHTLESSGDSEGQVRLTPEQTSSICCKLATLNTLSRMYESLHISNKNNNNNNNNSSSEDNNDDSCYTENMKLHGAELPSFEHVDDVQENHHNDKEYTKEELANSQVESNHQSNSRDIFNDERMNESSMSLDPPPTPDLMMEGWPDVPIEDETTTAPNAVTEALQEYNLQ